MKLINIAGSPSFELTNPDTYRRSAFLTLALKAFESGRVKRVANTLGDSRGTCACILGLFTDNYAIARNHSLHLGVDDLYKLPVEQFPIEARNLDRPYLEDVLAFSDNNNNWYNNGQLRPAGKKALSNLIHKYGMAGISQQTGLAAFAQ